MLRSVSRVAAAGPMGHETDEQLVELVRVGDPVAFDTLVTRHLERAYRIAFRILGHREDAEDLVQESFLAVLQKIDTFQAGRAFTPWLNRIVANRALNARQARTLRTTEQIPLSTQAVTASPAREAERAQLRERLGQAMDALPERQRIILELFELEGYSGPEIAEMLEIAPGTVRWHLHEARRALREALAPLETREEQ